MTTTIRLGKRRLVASLAAVALVASVTASAHQALAATAPTSCDRIAWSGFDGTTSQIWLANSDGTSRVSASNVPPAGAPIDNRSVFWSSDGSRLAWSGSNGSSYQIYVSDGAGASRMLVSDLVGSNVPYDNGSVDWSPDDSKIAWSGHDGSNFQIYVANPDGTAREKITVNPLEPSADPTRNRDPQWSPDGKSLAWSGVGPTGQQIWVANADGSSRATMSDSGNGTFPTLNRFPQWSPDGRWLAWYGMDPVSMTNQVYVANTDGSGRAVISNVGPAPSPTNNKFPRWSPDGTKLAWSGFNAATASDEIWVANVDGSSRLMLSAVGTGVDPIANQHPEWSPDGTRIAWQGKIVNTEIFVAAADGTSRTVISNVSPGVDPTLNQQPMWRHREVGLALTTSSSAMVVGSTVDVTVTVSTNCPTSDLTLSGLDLPCLGSATRSATIGVVDSSGIWNVGQLNGSATATLSGVVKHSGACRSTATVVSSSPPEPVPSTVVIGRIGSDALPGCDYSPTPFTDVSVSSFAFDDVACIYNLGITGGTTTTTYSPANNVTREQMASFLARFWRTAGGTCDYTATPFNDVPALSFAFSDVACIYNLGITGGTTLTTYSPYDEVTREQMAAFLARLWRKLGGVCDLTATPFTDLDAASFSFDDTACIYNLGLTTGISSTLYAPAGNVTREQMASFLARTWRSTVVQGLRAI